MNKKNTVTAEAIEKIISEGTVHVQTIGTKTTMVAFTTKEGFVITESSSCVDPINYDVAMGTEICIGHIKIKLWELEGYRLQKALSNKHTVVSEATIKVNTDGLEEATKKMREIAGIYANVDTLQQRIIKGQQRIDAMPACISAMACMDKQYLEEKMKKALYKECGVPKEFLGGRI